MFALAGCKDDDPDLLQGYVEGDFVHVAAPSAGKLVKLAVRRGTEVKEGAALFTLDSTPEQIARDEAVRRVAQARATLEDLKQGQRPTEVAAIRAQLDQAKAALRYSSAEYERRQQMHDSGAIAVRDVDAARAQQEQDAQRVLQLEANLETAGLGSRAAQIAAGEQAVRVKESQVARAEWNLAEKSQSAPVSAEVTDVVYHEGDWVGAGAPVVVLLPAANTKVRTFVTQEMVGRIQTGRIALVYVDGVEKPYSGTVTSIAPKAEFTPPVIYSQKMRKKFVYLVELGFPADVATKLHPGQPVDVRFQAN